MSERDLFSDADPSPATPHVNPFAAEHAKCQKCGATEYVDHRLMHAPHNGRSVRRDCARCGWTFGFPLWYGEEAEAAE